MQGEEYVGVDVRGVGLAWHRLGANVWAAPLADRAPLFPRGKCQVVAHTSERPQDKPRVRRKHFVSTGSMELDEPFAWKQVQGNSDVAADDASAVDLSVAWIVARDIPVFRMEGQILAAPARFTGQQRRKRIIFFLPCFFCARRCGLLFRV